MRANVPEVAVPIDGVDPVRGALAQLNAAMIPEARQRALLSRIDVLRSG
jgi:hypothetical protein